MKRNNLTAKPPLVAKRQQTSPPPPHHHPSILPTSHHPPTAFEYITSNSVKSKAKPRLSFTYSIDRLSGIYFFVVLIAFENQTQTNFSRFVIFLEMFVLE